MKKILSVFILIASLQGLAQDAYFQQEVNYKINVKLDDVNHYLMGDESFEYINNSPDTLREIYIHLWPNAYKNAKSSLAKQLARDGNFFLYYASQKDKGGIDSLQFKVDNTPVTFSFYQGYEDIAVIALASPLLPGKKINISTPFRVKIPSGSISRLGHIGESYQITQWYPKPAVYDKNGWNPIPYLTQGEFYSEFGSFDVTITLPENYSVGATGDLMTASENERLDKLSKLPLPEKLSNEFPASSSTLKTIQYKASNVHDFGWFADKRWIIRKGEVKLPFTGRTVTTWAMYTPNNSKEWEKGVEFINDAITSYSTWVGEYPYNQCIAVDGTISAGGGMEYPGVTVIGSSGNEFQLATVIIHEVGHNWFYGILGSNERRYGWMDEGINSFMETLTLENKYKDPKIYDGMFDEKVGQLLGVDHLPLNYQNEVMYQIAARVGKDQAIDTPSEDFTSMNYGMIMYKKTGLAFNYLRNYLGDEKFKECMHAYFDQWKFKHPQPEDIRNIFEEKSGKNLSWFFDDVISTTRVIDYKTDRVAKRDGVINLAVFNAGSIAAPYSVSIMRDGQLISTKWMEGFDPGEWKTITVDGAKAGDEIKVNYEKGTLDIDRGNNNIRTTGILRTREPLSFSLLSGIDDPEKTKVFWTPLVAWNNYDRWMVGVNLHNRTLPLRKFNASFTPLYSPATKSVNGMANIEFIARNARIGMSAKTFTEDRQARTNEAGDKFGFFARYAILNPYTEWRSKTKTSINGWSTKARIDGFVIVQSKVKRDGMQLSGSSADFHYQAVKGRFELTKNFIGGYWKIEPVGTAFFSDEMIYAFETTSEVKMTYWKRKKKAVYVRGYYGIDINDSGALPISIGGTTGMLDLFYENFYFGRSDQSGLLENQIITNRGGVYVPGGYYFGGRDLKVTTLQVEADLPYLPLSVFGGIALYNLEDNDFSAGVSLPIKRDVFQIFLPLVYSSNIQNSLDRRDIKIGESIMFELNLDMMNPFSLLK